jgi:dipeptidyl aminopeptidase/acylaminoacyl peptidase
MPPPAILGPNESNAEQSSRVEAVVSDSGPLDLVAGHEQNQLRTVIEKFMGGPLDGPRHADYQRASPASYVVAADTADGARKPPPLLLIYGVVDNQVNVSTADAFVTALGRAGHKDVSYFRLANADHCPHSLARIPYLQQVVVEFFQRTLKPSPAHR